MKKILSACVADAFFASPAIADDKAAPAPAAKPAAAPAAAPSKEVE
jgi:hypothetical protein